MPIADDIFGNVLFQVVAMMNFNCTREERNIMLKCLSYQVSMDFEQKKEKNFISPLPKKMEWNAGLPYGRIN